MDENHKEKGQLWSMAKIRGYLGGVSDDTVHRLFNRQEFRRVKIGQLTFALAGEVRAYVMRIVPPQQPAT